MSVRHTPGPWTYIGSATVQAGDGASRFEMLLTRRGSGAPPEEWEANARLMAAAPDLLTFVQAFAEVPTEGEVPGTWNDKAAILIARQLVAKASPA